MNEKSFEIAAIELVYLVACAVNEQKPDAERCAAMDLRQVYALAQLHMLTSAAAIALEQVGELPRPFDQAKKKTIRRLALYDIERAKLFRALEEEKIWYLPLKGIVLKDCYPQAAMREMTDNDILCDPGRMEDVKQIMGSLGYACEAFGISNHDVYTKPPMLCFEMHRALFDEEFTLPGFERFENIGERLQKEGDGGYRRRMTNDEFYLYLICHLNKHYRYAGTGLRSLLDVYLYQKQYRSVLNSDALASALEQLGLASFEKTVRELAEKLFTLQPLSEAERADFLYLAEMGSHGTSEQEEKNRIVRPLRGDDSPQAKRAYWKRRVLLSGKDLEENYPFVARHKILYPLLLVYRPVKGVLLRPKKLAGEYRSIKKYRAPSRLKDDGES